MTTFRMQKKNRSLPSNSGILREYFFTIISCSIFALFLTIYVIHPMSVPTPSMEPTILIGDRVLVDKFTIRNGFTFGSPLTPIEVVKRQDIVVCKSPLQPTILLVKRIIGMPEDQLEIRNKIVYINNKPLDEPYKKHSDNKTYSRNEQKIFLRGFQRDNYGPVTLPKASYFVMGDNRDDSLDSRYWNFLPHQNLVGKPLFIFWSFQDSPNSHLKTSFLEILKLYTKRIILFPTHTRWKRMGRFLK